MNSIKELKRMRDVMAKKKVPKPTKDMMSAARMRVMLKGKANSKAC